jgi:CRISPR-associated DxTHG motif protein
MAHKVFISVLGTGYYHPCTYGDTVISTRFIQEATLLHIGARNWRDDDTGLVLLTDSARRANWEVPDNRRMNKSTSATEDYCGLKQRLDAMQLPFGITGVTIPDGKNEDEMWAIFNIVFDTLRDGDELFIDLTHAFRYLPMLVLVLANYAKFLKNATVKSLTYGNYEAREGTNAPIVNLLPIAALQDWTTAAAALLQHGDAKSIKEVFDTHPPIAEDQQANADSQNDARTFVESLVAVTSEIQTCRGTSIIQATNIRKLKESLRLLQPAMHKPLRPIMEKISLSFDRYSTETDLVNGWLAAEWALQHNLLQQAATILQENAVSFFCQRHDIDTFDEYRRNSVNKAISIATQKLPKEKWDCKSEKEIARVERLLCDQLLTSQRFLDTFNALSKIRNDLNHFGMRKKPKQWHEIRRIITESHATLTKLLSATPSSEEQC